MNTQKVDPRYTVLGMLAGAGVGLLAGALFFALLLPPPSNTFKIVTTYTLIGLIPLAAGVLVVGLGVLRIIKRRRLHPFTAALIVFALSLGIALVVSAIATAFGINFFLALVGFGVPVIWCMTIAAILLPWLSRHRTASVASLVAVAAVCIAGLFDLG
jgi:hypothetical protein